MQPSPPLTRDTIHSTLSTTWLGRRIELFDCLPSTNREAVQLAQAEVEHGTVVVADSQTAGRGRLSRTWFSPPGANLYCSIILRTARPPERLTEWLSWLPLISALAAAEAIEQVSSIQVSVKWPNDLLISARKVGGILCESGTGIDQTLSRSSESASTSTLTTMTGPLTFATQPRRYGRNGRSSSTATDCSRSCSSNSNSASMN